MDQNTALSCGLVLNECIANSAKHAFLNHSGLKKITVRGKHVKKDLYELSFEDNGQGFDGCIEKSSPHHSFGIWLITNIVEGQLEGSVQCESKKGTRWTIRFPAPKTIVE